MAKQRRGRGEGSIYQRGDGYWIGQVEAGYYANGRRRKARVVRRYRKDVVEALDELRRQARAGEFPATGKSVESYLTWWLDEVKAREVSAGSLREYRIRVRRITPIIGKHRLGKLTAAHVQHLANRLSETRISLSTRAHTLSTLRSALRWAVQAGLIPRNPAEAVTAPRSGPTAKLDDRLEPAEVDKVIRAAQDDDLYALVWLALSYGLRLGELRSLRWADIDWDMDLLHVRKSKTAAGVRTLPMIPECRAVLQAHRRGQAVVSLDGYVFVNQAGRPLRDKTVYKRWNAILAAAGIEHRCRSCGTDDTCSTSVRRFHSSRHTAATRLLEAGVPVEIVSAVLGHTTLSMTVDTYSRVRADLTRRSLTAALATARHMPKQ